MRVEKQKVILVLPFLIILAAAGCEERLLPAPAQDKPEILVTRPRIEMRVDGRPVHAVANEMIVDRTSGRMVMSGQVAVTVRHERPMQLGAGRLEFDGHSGMLLLSSGVNARFALGDGAPDGGIDDLRF